MELNERVKAFSLLSDYLINFSYNENAEKLNGLDLAVKKASYYNPWFGTDNIIFSLHSLGFSINEVAINKWLINYPEVNCNIISKRVGVVMAGNLPLVGFHDFFYVLMSGHKVIAKLSSDDQYLLPALAAKLIEFEPKFTGYIEFANQKLEAYDAVIATGSNNSARYFEYYFGKHPHIIRKNRNAIAVLSGKESYEELEALSNDILRYYGMGCRNVSRLFVPENYKFDELLAVLAKNENLVDNSKYRNNYEYYKSIYLINQQPFYDNGSLIFKNEKLISSPVSVVYYDFYKTKTEVIDFIELNSDKIQCVISSKECLPEAIPFGEAQYPGLFDYADGVDVMNFLLKL